MTAPGPLRTCGQLVYCDDPAFALWRYSCVHEHVREGWTCPDHEPAPGQVGCARCLQAGHECEMTAVLVRRLGTGDEGLPGLPGS